MRKAAVMRETAEGRRTTASLRYVLTGYLVYCSTHSYYWQSTATLVHATVVSFLKGDKVIAQGSDGDTFYIVISGEVSAIHICANSCMPHSMQHESRRRVAFMSHTAYIIQLSG